MHGAHGWERIAAWLDPALDGVVTPPVVPRSVVAAARACGVLTFADGMAVAATFATERLGAIVGAEFRAAELWHLKEGHTSSVWRVLLRAPDGSDAGVIALNVARDRPAGDELERSVEVLDALGATRSVPVAHVIGGGRVPHPSAPHGQVAVVVQEWMEGARELGFAPARDGVRLHAIDAFLIDEAWPGRISGVRGTPLTDAEHRDVAYDLTRAVLAAARTHPEGLVLPHVDIHQGDCVWCDGQLGIVAAAALPDVVAPNDVAAHVLTFLGGYVPEEAPAHRPLRAGAEAALRAARREPQRR